MADPAGNYSFDVDTESSDEGDVGEAPVIDSDGSEAEDISPAEAAELLYENLVDSFLCSEMSAKSISVIAYVAKMAGVKGSIEKIALPPHADESSFHRKVTKAVGLREHDDRLQTILVPGYHKSDRSRAQLSLPVVPPHESFHDEVTSNPEVLSKVRDVRDGSEWCSSFAAHPAVTLPGPTAMPAALYVDGIPYSNSDGVISFWCYSLITGVRHLCVVIRRRHLCCCGCNPQGWCTINAILTYLAWSMKAMVEGIFPRRTHTDQEWDDSEPVRKDLAGSPLGFRVAFVQIKADWAEWAHTLGFPSWSRSEFPCALCHADHSNWLDCSGVSPLGIPDAWGVPSTNAELEDRCRACEIRVRVSRAQHRDLLSILEYSRVLGGRGLGADYPALGLERGDLLAAEPTLLDVGQGFDDLFKDGSLSCTVLFWRRRYATKLLHRVPIFSEALGVGVESMAIDVMHAVHLGVMQRFCSAFLWACLQMNVFEVPARTANERRAGACLIIKEQLQRFYGDYRRRHGKSLTEISDFVPGMLGLLRKPKLKLKAAETWSFLLYIHDSIHSRYGDKLGPNRGVWTRATDSLVEWMWIIQREGPQLSISAHDGLCECVRLHLASLKRLCISLIPKHHIWIHLTVNAGRDGNPRYYWTFLDEHLNGTLKKIMRRCHQTTFERRALAKAHLVIGAGQNRKRPRTGRA